jgi:hypothetical protein
MPTFSVVFRVLRDILSFASTSTAFERKWDAVKAILVEPTTLQNQRNTMRGKVIEYRHCTPLETDDFITFMVGQ